MPNDEHELRKITDARTLRALAHPVRIALFEELALGGAMTATVVRMFRERQFARYDEWRATKGSYPRRWQEAAINSQFLLYLTAPELEQLSGEVHELLARWTHLEDRREDPSKR